MFMKNQKIIESDLMSNVTKEYISDYIRGTIPKRDDMFSIMESYAYENNIPIVEPEVAQLIDVMIKISKPKEILEVGTAIGYSALIMASSYNESRITTIERNENMIEEAKNNINKSEFGDR